jgi:hypothetical protein
MGPKARLSQTHRVAPSTQIHAILVSHHHAKKADRTQARCGRTGRTRGAQVKDSRAVRARHPTVHVVPDRPRRHGATPGAARRARTQTLELPRAPRTFTSRSPHQASLVNPASLYERLTNPGLSASTTPIYLLPPRKRGAAVHFVLLVLY